MTEQYRNKESFQKHHEHYAWMADETTREMLSRMCINGEIPPTDDLYLNHLPLAFWDNLPLRVKAGTLEALNQSTLTPSNRVCILKAAARDILEKLGKLS